MKISRQVLDGAKLNTQGCRTLLERQKHKLGRSILEMCVTRSKSALQASRKVIALKHSILYYSNYELGINTEETVNWNIGKMQVS